MDIESSWIMKFTFGNINDREEAEHQSCWKSKEREAMYQSEWRGDANAALLPVRIAGNVHRERNGSKGKRQRDVVLERSAWCWIVLFNVSSPSFWLIHQIGGRDESQRIETFQWVSQSSWSWRCFPVCISLGSRIDWVLWKLSGSRHAGLEKED